MVAVGAQGNITDADGFMDETGLRTATVVWDDAYAVWRHYEVYGQPTALLLDAKGNLIHEFGGRFRAEDVLGRL